MAVSGFGTSALRPASSHVRSWPTFCDFATMSASSHPHTSSVESRRQRGGELNETPSPRSSR